MNLIDKAALISQKLKKEFPDVDSPLHHSTAMEMLVATILSAQCTDVRVNLTTETLFKKYKSVDDYADADLEVMKNDLRAINFRNNKAKNIIAAAKLIHEKHNGQVPGNLEDLVALPGVGRKTANVVLGQWFRKPEGFVVDTHVKRCAKRMGLTKHTDVVKIEQDLMKLFPQKDWNDMSIRIILHGRTTCPARRKKDQPCSLGELCTA